MKKNIMKLFTKNLFLVVVVVPNITFGFYQLIMASPRYESRTQIVVKQQEEAPTIDASMALLSGLGVPSSNQDTELVRSYISSGDMLNYLESRLKIREHYSDDSNDYFSRLELNSSREQFYNYYLQSVNLELDEKSNVLSIYVQAFSPEFANRISEAITERAEWFINNISHDLAKSQLDFVRKEHKLAEDKLEKAKLELLVFQRKNNLIDPKQDTMAISQIGYQLEGRLAEKKTELKATSAIMSDSSSIVVNLKNEIMALEEQINIERGKLIDGRSNQSMTNTLATVLSKYANLQVKLEIAMSSFTASTLSFEKARIEAYRKLKHLVVIDSPTLPESNKYPQYFYNISLLLMLTLMLFGLLRLGIATIKEIG